mgnify:FL=1
MNDFNLLRRQPEHPRQDVRHRAQKWNVGLERRKELETFRGRLRKRTPFLRWRAQLDGMLKLWKLLKEC